MWGMAVMLQSGRHLVILLGWERIVLLGNGAAQRSDAKQACQENAEPVFCLVRHDFHNMAVIGIVNNRFGHKREVLVREPGGEKAAQYAWFTSTGACYTFPPAACGTPHPFFTTKSKFYGCHSNPGNCLSYRFNRCIHFSWRAYQQPDEKLQFAGLKRLPRHPLSQDAKRGACRAPFLLCTRTMHLTPLVSLVGYAYPSRHCE